jgi:hypothetical protein
VPRQHIAGLRRIEAAIRAAAAVAPNAEIGGGYQSLSPFLPQAEPHAADQITRRS